MSETVKPGYKQTEVGVIPEEWVVEPLEDIVVITSGFSPTGRVSDDGVTPYYKVETLNQEGNYLSVVNYRVKSPAIAKAGEIVFPKRGASIFLNKVKIFKYDSSFDTNLMSIKVSINYSNIYIFYSLLRFKLSNIADVTSVPQINNKHIRPIKLAFPPLSEQRAIASALADMDALLDSLEDLLTKKRQLKQAAMQELLTGRRRLEGFEGEWQEKPLKDVAILDRTTINPSSSPRESFMHFSLPAFDAGKVAAIDQGASIGSIKFLVSKDAILLSKLNPRIPRIWLPIISQTARSLASTEFLVLQPKLGFARPFLFAALSSPYFLNEFEKSVTGTTGSHQRVSPHLAMDIILRIPATIEEQEAIAAVVSEIDAELEALEERLSKTRDLKQGMMQELLTGRTRLI